jgi:hypothetical protein
MLIVFSFKRKDYEQICKCFCINLIPYHPRVIEMTTL